MRRAIHSVAELLAVALLAGCDSTELGQSLPVFGLQTERLDFSEVAVGDEKALPVRYGNSGQGRLFVFAEIDLSRPGAFAVFRIATPVEAGDTGEAEIVFHPPDVGDFEATLVLTTNDRSHPEGRVALTGTGFRRGQIEVEPPVVDFGTVNAGEAALGQVFIRNVGNGDLLLTDLALSPETDPAFHIQSSTRTPATLAENTELTVVLAYRPGRESLPPGEGRLVVSAADPFQPHTAVRLLARLNQAPIAVAGPDQEVAPLTPVTLDGSASTDPDGNLPLSFVWSLVRRPEGSQASLSATDIAVTGFTPDLVGVYESELSVSDATHLRSLLPDRVAVTALPAERILAELVWDSPIADLDLHLIAPGGSFGGLLDCNWSNPAPDWGAVGAADDPRLLRDDLAGFGPETIGYAEPQNGVYGLVVDFYAAHTPSGNEPTSATLRVFVDGLVKAEITRRLSSQGLRWTVARVRWPEGSVEKIDTLE